MAAFSTVMSMAPAPVDPVQMQRPSMRRKSSAQNLLNSFKPNANGTISSATAIPFASTPTSIGPMPAPMLREFDVQSLHSDSTAGGTPSLSQVQGTSIEILREVVRKRIITLTYLRNVHEGRSHWFHTIMITRADLDRAFSNAFPKIQTRTLRYTSLGMSLAHSFDMKEPQDFLRGLQNSLGEYDRSKDDGEGPPKMKSLFRSGKGKRQAGTLDYTMSYADSSESTYLITPSVPFQMDYHQTLLSLLDVLSEVYNKISKMLGPSPFPSSGQHMMGPLGLLSPHPGVSYLFSSTDPTPTTSELDSSLWGIANANPPTVTNNTLYGGGLGSPPPSWNSTLSDAVRQIDGRLKKLIATLLKELDDLARAGIRDELASLDPLLRNAAVPDDGRDMYDFE
ncbi:hypothetical protein C8Q75DRAFT_751599 [Abortiporus biennis]|nr:hypothetical protein C8Q75DRAFT_751599 [Abortiporus biennis]